MFDGDGLPVQVAVIDKSPLILAALRALLLRDGRFELVYCAHDHDGFLAALDGRPCDVAVSGWIMPDGGGRRVLQSLKGRDAAPKVIIYSGDPDATLPRKARALGAAAFVSKQASPDQLLEVILAVARGQVVSPTLPCSALGDDPMEALSPRERELLEALGSGRTNVELAELLGLSVNTVKFHLRNLFDKIGVRNKAQAVHLLHQSRR